MAERASTPVTPPHEKKHYKPPVKGEAWKPKFLAAFIQSGTITAACEAVGVARKTVYNARQRDEAFALAFADADEAVTEGLEQEAIRRALDSSDRLLEFLLKARRPDLYSDTLRMLHRGQVDVNATVRLTPEQAAAELDAFEMPAAKHVAAGPDSVPAPEDA